MNKTTFCATSYIGENKFFPYRCLWDNGVDYLMDTHGSLQVTSLNDPPGCGLFQAKILEPEHLAAHKATCKKWTATSQPRQAWDSSCKPVLGGQIKPLLRHTNHGVSRNNKNEPRTRILITQRNYHKKKKKSYSHSLPSSIQKQPHKEEHNLFAFKKQKSSKAKSFKTISACNFSNFWKESGQEAPRGLAAVNEIIHYVGCCISLLCEATPIRNFWSLYLTEHKIHIKLMSRQPPCRAKHHNSPIPLHLYNLVLVQLRSLWHLSGLTALPTHSAAAPTDNSPPGNCLPKAAFLLPSAQGYLDTKSLSG